MLSDSELQSFPRRFKHLSKFVNRDNEYQQFDRLIKNPVSEREKFILAFHGPAGMGKSMLLQRLEFECRKRDVAHARIVLDQGGDTNIPVEIMRQIATQLGEAEFAKWFELELFWSSPPDLNLPSQAGTVNISGDNFQVHGDIVAGNKVEISNLSSRAALNPLGAQGALTQTFLQALGRFAQNKGVVIILDGFDSEEFSTSTRKWLTDNLLDKTRELEGFGVLPVIALLNQPNFPDPSLKDDTAGVLLKPLSQKHILEYFQIRKIPDEMLQDASEVCLTQTQGIPSRVFEFVEALLNPPS